MFCWIVLALSESVEFIVVYILCMVEICVGTVEIEKPMGVTEYSRRGIRSRGIDIERERERIGIESQLSSYRNRIKNRTRTTPTYK